MKKINKNLTFNTPKWLIVLGATLLIAVGHGPSASGESTPVSESAAEPGDQPDDYQKLFDYTVVLMDSLNTTLDDGPVRLYVADVLVKQALRSFDGFYSAKSWLTFVGIQSRFDARGPRDKKIKGIGRLAPWYKKYLIELCPSPGSKEVKVDLRAVKDGSRVSACYFSALLKETGSLIATYGLYREGAFAKKLIRNTLVKPDSETLYDNVLASNLFPDGITPRASSVFAQLSLLSTADSTRKIVDTWIIADAARLFLSSDRQVEAWLSAVASINGLNSYNRPKLLSKKIVGLGAISRELDREELFGCGGDKIGARDRGDAYISTFLSACMFKVALDSAGGDSDLAAGLFVFLQQGKIKTLNVLTGQVAPKIQATSLRINNVKKALILINTTNIKYSNVESGFDPKLINIHAASAAGEAIFGDGDSEDWFILLRIENNFNHNGVSSAGATGIGQLMPEYVSDFGKSCGVYNASRGDVQDLAMNALLSSCYFRQLLDEQRVVHFALAGYNAGPNSKTLERVKQFSSINKETANYIVKFSLAKEFLANPEVGRETRLENHLLSSAK